jgi:hypothetical protein
MLDQVLSKDTSEPVFCEKSFVPRAFPRMWLDASVVAGLCQIVVESFCERERPIEIVLKEVEQ